VAGRPIPTSISPSSPSLYAGVIASLTIDELPGWARALLDEERVARLAYVDDRDRPRVLPVTFAVAGGAVWSAIDDKPKSTREPARVRYLRRRPAAAVCVDRYDGDWSRLAWVQLLGEVEIIGAADAPAAMDALAARYAPYRERRPPGPLLRLEPARALHWRALDAPPSASSSASRRRPPA
jgi:PPOX class probable F420-dependent enzyme